MKTPGDFTSTLNTPMATPYDLNLNLAKVKNEDVNGVKIKINDINELLDESFDNTYSKSESIGPFGRTVQTVRTENIKKKSDM